MRYLGERLTRLRCFAALRGLMSGGRLIGKFNLGISGSYVNERQEVVNSKENQAGGRLSSMTGCCVMRAR